jgi:hypothetical protein
MACYLAGCASRNLDRHPAKRSRAVKGGTSGPSAASRAAAPLTARRSEATSARIAPGPGSSRRHPLPSNGGAIQAGFSLHRPTGTAGAPQFPLPSSSCTDLPGVNFELARPVLLWPGRQLLLFGALRSAPGRCAADGVAPAPRAARAVATTLSAIAVAERSYSTNGAVWATSCVEGRRSSGTVAAAGARRPSA